MVAEPRGEVEAQQLAHRPGVGVRPVEHREGELGRRLRRVPLDAPARGGPLELHPRGDDGVARRQVRERAGGPVDRLAELAARRHTGERVAEHRVPDRLLDLPRPAPASQRGGEVPERQRGRDGDEHGQHDEQRVEARVVHRLGQGGRGRRRLRHELLRHRRQPGDRHVAQDDVPRPGDPGGHDGDARERRHEQHPPVRWPHPRPPSAGSGQATACGDPPSSAARGTPRPATGAGGRP